MMAFAAKLLDYIFVAEMEDNTSIIKCSQWANSWLNFWIVKYSGKSV